MAAKTKREFSGKCSLCGYRYDGYAFKGGHVCETCLQYIKDHEPGH